MSRGKFTAPVRVSEVLAAAVPELGERMLEETIRKEWRLTVGADMARRSQPAELRSGTLTVIVRQLAVATGDASAVRRAARGLAGPLRHRGERAPLRLGPAGAQARAARAAAGGARGEAHRLEALEVEKTGAQLNDPTLAAALRRLMTKDLIARRQARPAGPGDRREDA